MSDNVAAFPERPFARFLRVEMHVWDDTGGPVWVVYLDNQATGEPRELGTFDTQRQASQFTANWAPDRDLFGNLLPLPEADDERF